MTSGATERPAAAMANTSESRDAFPLSARELRVAVIIATAGRAETLAMCLEALRNQTQAADEVVVVASEEGDVLDEDRASVSVMLLRAAGCAEKRNLGADASRIRPDIFSFIDDDTIISKRYLENVRRDFFEHRPVLMMGHIVKNGDVLPEDIPKAFSEFEDSEESRNGFIPTSATWGHVYGANMCVARHLFESERFDERLKLYSLMEDVDYGTRARRRGMVGYSFSSFCIHLRVSGGRISDRQLGFSEIMNPVYLSLKGTVPAKWAWLDVVAFRLFSNIGKMGYRPSRAQMRRLHGNLAALYLVMSFRVCPEKICDI